MKLLDLGCCAGGASYGYHLAGFDVTGADIAQQECYPFRFIEADMLEIPLDGYDVIHASPPCQRWTAYRRRPGHVRDYPDLIGPVRERLEKAGVPYVIENIPGAPLHNPALFCGSSFGLDVRRHRLFETNFPLTAPPCDHDWQAPRFAPATNRRNLRRTVEIGVWRIPLEIQREAMGIHWMSREQLSQAVPSAYTQWIGRQLTGSSP